MSNNNENSINEPDLFGCAYDNGYLWITEYKDKALMKIDASTGALIDSFAINREVLPLKIINGNLYGVEFVDGTVSGPMQLIEFDKSTGVVLDSIPLCFKYVTGFVNADEHLWGLSSLGDGGTQRIYQFDSTFILPNGFLSPEPKQVIKVEIYPNPFSSTATLLIENEQLKMDNARFIMYNLLGQKVKGFSIPGSRNPQLSIDRSGLPGGIYFYKITSGKQLIANGKLMVAD